MQNRLLPTLRRTSHITSLARRSGWLVRKPKILSPTVFVRALVASVSAGYCSLREIATEVGLLTGATISKQALAERFTPSGVKFLKGVVTGALREAAASLPVPNLAHLPGISRILVGDSSTLSLHRSLFDHFPGATGGRGLRVAQLKFQFTFELLSGRWLQADLGPYRVPDQASAGDILGTVVRAGDLVIRDLGYAVIEVFAGIAGAGAFFLSRLAPGVTVMGADGVILTLNEIVRAGAGLPGDTFTRRVLLGAERRFACRLVIIRVPQKVADERRRRIRATAKRKGRAEPTKAYLALQDWTFLVTNLDETQADNARLEEFYRLRWRVENLFKLSKGPAGLQGIARHRTSPAHVEMLLWAWMLLMITVGNMGVFRLLEPGAPGTAPEVVHAGIFKGIGRILGWVAHSLELDAAGDFASLTERLRQQQDYHGKYEKRRRISIPQRLAKALKPRPVALLT